MKIDKIGIIGGTGLEELDFLSFKDTREIVNQYGQTSSKIAQGKISNIEVFVLSRHGVNHEFSPSSVNYRANIQALKDLECDLILALTACGSLQEQYKPGDFFLPDQFIDWTKNRKCTFYEDPTVIHTPMSEPFSESSRKILKKELDKLKLDCHYGGTLVSIEGPRFNTKAESLLFKSLGFDIINMTTSTECMLANELGLEYQAIAMVTDYDCWNDSVEPVSMESIKKVMIKNSTNAISLLRNFIVTLGN